MDKEEWIEKQLKAYRAKLERDFDRYVEKDKLTRAWIKEHKDIEPGLCEILEFLLDKMMLGDDEHTTDGRYLGTISMRSWQSILALFRGVEDSPIRRGRE